MSLNIRGSRKHHDILSHKSVTPNKKIVVKCKLEETDNENRYFLINGPVYLRKSLIDLTKPPQLDGHNTDDKSNLHEELSSILEEVVGIVEAENELVTTPELKKEIVEIQKKPVKSEKKHLTTVELGKKLVAGVELEKQFVTTNDADETEEGINELERWRRCCEKGIFSLNRLLYVCEKDPDSIMEECRKYRSKDKRLLLSEAQKGKEEPISQIQLTHGELFGDAKYHFLMVDAHTSTTSTKSTQFKRKVKRVKKLRKRKTEEPAMVPSSRRLSGVSDDITILQIGKELNKTKSRHVADTKKQSTPDARPSYGHEQLETKVHNSTVSWSYPRNLTNIEKEKKPSAENDSSKFAESLITTPKRQSKSPSHKSEYALLGEAIQRERRKSTGKVSIQEQKLPEQIPNVPSTGRISKLFNSLLSKKDNKPVIKRSIMKNTEPINTPTTSRNDNDANDDSSSTSEKPSEQAESTSFRRDGRRSTSSYKFRVNPVANPIHEHEDKLKKYLSNF